MVSEFADWNGKDGEGWLNRDFWWRLLKNFPGGQGNDPLGRGNDFYRGRGLRDSTSELKYMSVCGKAMLESSRALLWSILNVVVSLDFPIGSKQGPILILWVQYVPHFLDGGNSFSKWLKSLPFHLKALTITVYSFAHLFIHEILNKHLI